MTLSWSPGFCDLGGEEKSPEQCAAGAGNGFVVHGLWPDNRYGPNPEECNPDEDASPADLATVRGLYPTEDLARYEYRKHGTCTGLSANDYFAAVRYVRDELKIPPMLQGPREWRRMSPAGDRTGLHRGERESRRPRTWRSPARAASSSTCAFACRGTSRPSPAVRRSRATPAIDRRSPSRRFAERRGAAGTRSRLPRSGPLRGPDGAAPQGAKFGSDRGFSRDWAPKTVALSCLQKIEHFLNVVCW